MVDLDAVSFDYPLNISLVPVMTFDPPCLTLAEQMIFESLTSFLYLNLYKRMATGNLPRRCPHCDRVVFGGGGIRHPLLRPGGARHRREELSEDGSP